LGARNAKDQHPQKGLLAAQQGMYGDTMLIHLSLLRPAEGDRLNLLQ
jgi:hypothetical protein